MPAYGGNRRVKGLRREEVALLAGVSIDYYVRMERGNLAGASEAVLAAVASALQLDEAEQAHLHDLANAAQPARAGQRRVKPSGVTDSVHLILDAIDAPAWVRNARHDMLAANALARALYAPVLADPRRPANNARFVYLDPASRTFFGDWDRTADDIAAMLRLEAGRHPHDKQLVGLIGELCTRSEEFRTRWAAHNVRFHRTGTKTINHPIVGRLDLTSRPWSSLPTPGSPCSSTPRRRDVGSRRIEAARQLGRHRRANRRPARPRLSPPTRTRGRIGCRCGPYRRLERDGAAAVRMAEDKRFELLRGCPQHAFQACALGH